MKWCDCMKVRPVRLAVADLMDEVVEFVCAPSMDEFSDVMWAIGRLIGGMRGKIVVRMPGDRLHYEKIVARMEDRGCVRSKRHRCGS